MKRIHVPEEASQHGRVRPVETVLRRRFSFAWFTIHLCNVIFVPNNCRLLKMYSILLVE
jgi:hypothetical protein